MKFFIDATLYCRALRRHAALKEKGKDESFEIVLTDLAKRDHQDQTLAFHPTTCDPASQWWLDTTTQSIAQTLREARERIRHFIGRDLFTGKDDARASA